MQAFNLFIAILLGGVGYANSLFLVLAQTFASAFFVLRTLFGAMRRRSLLLKVMASLIPMVIGGTYIIAASIVFGAFFSSYWSATEMLHLVESTLSYDFVYETLGWVGLFALLTLAYSLLYRPRLSEWLLTFGLEIITALALLVLYGGLLIDNFPFTILHLCLASTFWVKFPIYGLFMIIFKNFVLFCGLLIGTLLYERRRPLPNPDDYLDKQSFYEKQAQQYLTTDYLALGVCLFIFGFSVAGFFGWIIWDEYGGWPDLSKLSGDELTGVVFLLLIILVVIGYCLVGLLLIMRRLLPQTSRPYRQLTAIAQAQPDPAAIIELFYQEIVLPCQQQPERASWQLGRNVQSSLHFVVERKGIKVTVKWRQPQNVNQTASSHRRRRSKAQQTADAASAASYKNHTDH